VRWVADSNSSNRPLTHLGTEVAVADEAGGPAARPARTEALWADTRISPVEIALPGGVGFTLRAYRPSDEVATLILDRDAEAHLDEYEAATAAVVGNRRGGHEVDDEDLEETAEDESEDEEPDAEADDEAEEEELEEELAGDVEDVPLFLGRAGRIYLFHSAEKLVEFVQSDAEHDLSQLDTWSDLARRVRAADVVPLTEDSYELDLVVENLRGGPDAWDSTLVLKAGELARDVAYALRIDSVMTALSPGSPLDDLDEALRAADAGGVGSFFARRRLRKIPAQQSALGWRTIIGKISAATDWRD
jgi:hypothetical protein